MSLRIFTIKQFGENRWQTRVRFPVEHSLLLARKRLARAIDQPVEGAHEAADLVVGLRLRRRLQIISLAIEMPFQGAQPGNDLALDNAPKHNQRQCE